MQSTYDKLSIIFILFVFSLTSNIAYSNVWQPWAEPCGSLGCANLVSGSLSELCQKYGSTILYASSGLTVNQRYGGLVGVVYSQVSDDDSPNPVDSGYCVFANFQSWQPWAISYGKHKCESGQQFDKTTMQCVEKKDNNKCTAGNPIEIASGIKYQTDYDAEYFFNGKKFPLYRYYKSVNDQLSNYYESLSYGGRWSFALTDNLLYANNDLHFVYGYIIKVVTIYTPEKHGLVFASSDDINWENRTNGYETLEHNVNNPTETWTLHTPDGTTKIFDSEGKLTKITSLQYGTINLEYSPDFKNSLVPKFINIKSNQKLIFTYQYNKNDIVKVVDGEHNEINYTYDSIGNIVNVLYPDGSQKKYHYEDPVFLKSLTGVTDERGIRYATWQYDSFGYAISSEHAGGVEKTLLDFSTPGKTVITNPQNKNTIYQFENASGSFHLTSVEGQPTTNCAGANQNYTYTSDGSIASKTDWSGNKTTYIYNSKGQETSRTEASGTPVAKTITTEWHPTLNLKTKITEPDKETTFSYDANGFLLNQNTHSLP